MDAVNGQSAEDKHDPVIVASILTSAGSEPMTLLSPITWGPNRDARRIKLLHFPMNA